MTKGYLTKMVTDFQQGASEAVLYHSLPPQKWYVYAWTIGVRVFEVAVFLLFSFTAFTSLAEGLLKTFLPTGLAGGLSRILFQIIAPGLVTAWGVEETVRDFGSELILTSQRIWIKGSPFAWTRGHEIPLSEIRYLSNRRDALFIHLKSTKKTQVHLFPDSKQIVKAFTHFTGKNESN